METSAETSGEASGAAMLGVIFTITGIFAGIGVFLATMYSLTQVLLLEGRPRIAHFTQFTLILTVMASLFFWRDVMAARIIAVLLLPVAAWTFWIEPRWFKVFPILVALFALMLVLGYVQLN